MFAIRSKATGEYVGETGTAHFERDLGTDFDPYPESAWLLGASSHGKGYATEAAEAALRWFLRMKGPQRTVCIIDPQNVGSLRVAEKLGYLPIDERDYREKPVIAFERLP
ncbi:GNAT family N-acetyltransferase [Xanthomonas sp. NCPPB 2632]|uniref:GNAT family N-acetyltransferase n=1 Tax=Xanthomonas sp. NCPPB 2632 TaxID=3240912 RepID=UPI003514A1F1